MKKTSTRVLKAREYLVRSALADKKTYEYFSELLNAINDPVTNEELNEVHALLDPYVKKYDISSCGLFAKEQGSAIRYDIVVKCFRLMQTVVTKSPTKYSFKPTRLYCGSYGLKHILERWLQRYSCCGDNYVSNGEGCLVALLLKEKMPNVIKFDKIPNEPRSYSKNPTTGKWESWDPNIENMRFGRWFKNFAENIVDSYDVKDMPRYYSVMSNEEFKFCRLIGLTHDDFMAVYSKYNIDKYTLLVTFFKDVDDYDLHAELTGEVFSLPALTFRPATDGHLSNGESYFLAFQRLVNVKQLSHADAFDQLVQMVFPNAVKREVKSA